MAEKFWASKTGNTAAPIQQHHFTVSFGSKWQEYEVKSVTMPQLEVSEGAYRMGNHIYKYPGQQRWNDVTITIVDSGPAVSRLMGQLKDQGYNWESSGGMSKSRSNDNQTVQIRQHRVITNAVPDIEVPQKKGFFARLGFKKPEPPRGAGFTVADADLAGNADGGGGFHFGANIWTLKGAWIKSINFGTHDYSSDELISMEIVVTYDYAHVSTNGEGTERVFLETPQEIPDVEVSKRRQNKAADLAGKAKEAREAGNTRKAERLENRAKRKDPGVNLDV